MQCGLLLDIVVNQVLFVREPPPGEAKLLLCRWRLRQLLNQLFHQGNRIRGTNIESDGFRDWKLPWEARKPDEDHHRH